MAPTLRKKARISYYEPDEPNLDEYVFCVECADYVYEYCSIHGPLLVVPDDKVTCVHVLKRLGSGRAEQTARARDAQLVLRFLKRASSALRMPYTVQGLPTKMCDKDRCAIIAKQINDFLYMYYRETDLYTDSADQQGFVSMDFAQFLYMARPTSSNMNVSNKSELTNSTARRTSTAPQGLAPGREASERRHEVRSGPHR